MTRVVEIAKTRIGSGNPLVIIAGPCVVESRELAMKVARDAKKITDKLGLPYIYKSSYKKANRTSGNSFVGLGMDEALKILQEIKKEFDLPILTDVHSETEVEAAAEVADVLQIPAFLCRQTELLQAAGRTGRAVNIKKGQFMAPEDMHLQAEKVEAVGNSKVMLTERGATFGYHNLVIDMRSLVIMRDSGFPVILDATHSLQLPGGEKDKTGGQPEFIFPIARAGAAVGIDGLFLETHPEPSKALSDAATQLPFDLFEPLLTQVKEIDLLRREFVK
ncbi:MAG: 3-deoxy-8-phosphooctulonate synthase [Bacteroidetes bacterium]|nr:3-deoxy-8-phosphooctulonate synthase [Bacteroidota bacterium]MCL5738323.1 3-deoxy-8-phosphooctulonate synthase [Bacteroidota bacterium]